MKNFIEQIPIKCESFNVIKMNLVQTMLSTNTTKYWWKFVYWPIFKRSDIGQPLFRKSTTGVDCRANKLIINLTTCNSLIIYPQINKPFTEFPITLEDSVIKR